MVSQPVLLPLVRTIAYNDNRKHTLSKRTSSLSVYASYKRAKLGVVNSSGAYLGTKPLGGSPIGGASVDKLRLVKVEERPNSAGRKMIELMTSQKLL